MNKSAFQYLIYILSQNKVYCKSVLAVEDRKIERNILEDEKWKRMFQI